MRKKKCFPKKATSRLPFWEPSDRLIPKEIILQTKWKMNLHDLVEGRPLDRPSGAGRRRVLVGHINVRSHGAVLRNIKDGNRVEFFLDGRSTQTKLFRFHLHLSGCVLLGDDRIGNRHLPLHSKGSSQRDDASGDKNQQQQAGDDADTRSALVVVGHEQSWFGTFHWSSILQSEHAILVMVKDRIRRVCRRQWMLDSCRKRERGHIGERWEKNEYTNESDEHSGRSRHGAIWILSCYSARFWYLSTIIWCCLFDRCQMIFLLQGFLKSKCNWRHRYWW